MELVFGVCIALFLMDDLYEQQCNWSQLYIVSPKNCVLQAHKHTQTNSYISHGTHIEQLCINSQIYVFRTSLKFAIHRYISIYSTCSDLDRGAHVCAKAWMVSTNEHFSPFCYMLTPFFLGTLSAWYSSNSRINTNPVQFGRFVSFIIC